MDINEVIEELEHAIKHYWDTDYVNSKKMLKFVKSQQETIESLKCCGNCDDTHYTQCLGCKDLSNWQPIK